MDIQEVNHVSDDIISRLLGLQPDFVFERLNPRTRDPVQTFVGFGGRKDELWKEDQKTVFSQLRKRLASNNANSDMGPPGASGGVLAILGYELLSGVSPNHGERETPAAILLEPDLLVTLDHAADRAFLARGINAASELYDDVLAAFANPVAPFEAADEAVVGSTSWSAQISEVAFCEIARQAIAQMGKGKPVEGAVLSVRLRSPDRCDALKAYKRLRRINPSTYMFIARTTSVEAWGATSLGLVQMSNGHFLAETDGATHPYEAGDFVWTPSPKEIDEYDVVVSALKDALTPLADNSGARFVSQMEERRFFNLAHLFASMEGRLAEGRDGLDLVAALSPHGAAVGYKRQPALELIAKSEPTARDFFAGTIGFFGYDGSVDSAAVTRSMWQTDKGMTVHAGAKVVPASLPEEEYRECVLKTLALRKCVGGRYE
ncbi:MULTISPECIES: chorismate-binding protein [unclassified Shinella]|uniref:chorismate-binding protein n=1 Tax=unclassified Shinella TaxID=2643062 RepID=UPI00234F75F4|nr:chorismate-binding protein [Shinella sp. YE25]